MVAAEILWNSRLCPDGLYDSTIRYRCWKSHIRHGDTVESCVSLPDLYANTIGCIRMKSCSLH